MSQQLDVEAYIAITQVKARYCRFLDTKDWDGFTDQFTEDLELDVTPAGGALIRGREEAVASIRDSIETAQTCHQVHAPEMRIEGDVAHVVWAMQDRVIWSPGERPRPDLGGLTGFGHYHERYVRKDGRWRIAALRLTRLVVDFHPPVD